MRDVFPTLLHPKTIIFRSIFTIKEIPTCDERFVDTAFIQDSNIACEGLLPLLTLFQCLF